MTRNTLYAFLVEHIEAASGLRCIAEDQNGPAIDSPFFTIKIIGTQRIGHEISTLADLPTVDLTETVRGLRDKTVSINCYGVGAYDYVSQLLLYFRREAIAYDFRLNKIGMMEISGLRDLSFIKDAEFEERYQFDIHLSIIDSLSGTIRSIETVEVERTE